MSNVIMKLKKSETERYSISSPKLETENFSQYTHIFLIHLVQCPLQGLKQISEAKYSFPNNVNGHRLRALLYIIKHIL